MRRSAITPGPTSYPQSSALASHPAPPRDLLSGGLCFSLPDHSKAPDATHHRCPEARSTPPHVAEPLNMILDGGANIQCSKDEPIFSPPADTGPGFNTDIIPTKPDYLCCSPAEPSLPPFKFGPPGSTYLPLVVEGTLFDICYPPGKSTKAHQGLFDSIIKEEEARQKWHSRCLKALSPHQPSVASSDSFRLDSRWSSTSELDLWTHLARVIEGDIPFPLPTTPSYPLSPAPSALDVLNPSVFDLVRPESVGDRYSTPSSPTRSMADTTSNDPLGDPLHVKEAIVGERVNTQHPQTHPMKQQRRRGIVFRDGLETPEKVVASTLAARCGGDVAMSPPHHQLEEYPESLGGRRSDLYQWSILEGSPSVMQPRPGLDGAGNIRERRSSHNDAVPCVRKRIPRWKKLFTWKIWKCSA